MKIQKTDFETAANAIQKAKRIIIISHRSPDGDTLGANLALRLALKHQWDKEVISACVDVPPANMDFLPEIDSFVQDFDQSWADLIIAVDAGADYMLGYKKTKPALFSGAPPMVNFDHHASNDGYGQINLVDPEAASTTQIIYYFLAAAGLKIDKKIATCLLNGLYFDTGSFMHSNTTPEVLEVASNLLWRGADYKTIAKKQFKTMSVPQLKLYGKILERIKINSKGLAVSALNTNDFDDTGATPNDTTGAIDYLNSVPGGNFCCLLYEDRKGVVKGSFRTRVNDINLSELAGLFGGGGHTMAAGFSLPGRLQEINPQIKLKKP